MEFKIGKSTIVLEDDDLEYLMDVGFEFGIELTLEQICEISKTDSNFIQEAFKWGVSDTVVRESFMDTISNYFVGKNYPSDNKNKEDFKKLVLETAQSKGFKAYSG